MEFNLRKPQATDLFVVGKIVKAIGVKQFQSCYNCEAMKAYDKEIVAENTYTDENGKTQVREMTDEQVTQRGMIFAGELADLILGNLEVAQKDIFKFISNLSGMTVEEVGAMGIADFAEIIVTIIKMPDFKDFIKVVLKSFK